MIPVLLGLAALSSPPPIRVMVLGTYHFGNPGRDLHNVRADDMLTPRRQREIATVVEGLARFRPTKVALEATSERPDLSVLGYSAFTADDLSQKPDESVQIGYRLARQAGLPTVYGIDERGERYFPFDAVGAYAESHGQTKELEALGTVVEAWIKGIEKAQERSVGAALRRMNDPKAIERQNVGLYNSLLKIGDAKEQPGADLNAMWYLRNAKIFTKLASVARSGDRIVVVYGSGHAYWLRHLVGNTPGFVLEDPVRYLKG